jgi:5-keto-L-gluconate epimerase
VKISLAIAPQDAQPSAFVVFRDRLEVGIGKAARLGYDGVELALATREDIDIVRTRSLLADEGVELAAISTGRVFAEQKVWLTHPDAAIRRRATYILRGLVDLAPELGAGQVNIGRVRGGVADGDTFDVAEGRFFEGIGECAEHAAGLGVNILLEPVNRYEINYVNSVVPDGVGLLARLGRPNVFLMPDVFHMNIEDASIAGSLVAAGGQVGYVHLADSNRWAPGHGHTDFPAILGALLAIGYDRYVGVEILPFPSADEAARQAIEYLRTLIPRASA